jgi:hypothetical protein
VTGVCAGARRLGNQLALTFFWIHVLPFGIRPAVRDEFVAARFDPLDDLRALIKEQRIEVVRCGETQFVEQIEKIPLPDTVSVVAPRKISGRLRCRCRSAVTAKAT